MFLSFKKKLKSLLTKYPTSLPLKRKILFTKLLYNSHPFLKNEIKPQISPVNNILQKKPLLYFRKNKKFPMRIGSQKQHAL